MHDANLQLNEPRNLASAVTRIWGVEAMVLSSGSSTDAESDAEAPATEQALEIDMYVAAYASYPKLKTVP